MQKSTLACTEYQRITRPKSVWVRDQEKDLRGLTDGFAAAAGGDATAAAAAAAAAGAGATVFSASGGFAILLLTRPDTPPLIPATSWQERKGALSLILSKIF